MKRKPVRGVGSVITILFLLMPEVILPQAAFGLSYPPAALYHSEETNERFVKGDEVYLFHSGTDDVKTTIHVGDTITAYRVTPGCEVVPVGIIRVVSFAGENHLKGEVFAGEIKIGDIARKDKVSCLVVSAKACKE
jgi:hypothetical protein